MAPWSFSGSSSRVVGNNWGRKGIDPREERQRRAQAGEEGKEGIGEYLQLVFSRRENERQSLMILTQIESTLR